MLDTGILCNISVRCNKIINGQPVNRMISRNSCKGFQLVKRNIQKISNTLSSGVYIQSFSELRILCGNTDRAVAASANPILLASGGNQSRAGYGNRVRAHSQRFGKIRGNSESASNYKRNVGADRIQIFSCTMQSIYCRNCCSFTNHKWT